MSQWWEIIRSRPGGVEREGRIKISHSLHVENVLHSIKVCAWNVHLLVMTGYCLFVF